MRARSFAVLLVVVAVAACAPQGSHQSTEIAAMSDSWVEAFNAGDAGAVAGFYTEDCRLLPPNAEMAVGRATAEAAFQEYVGTGLTIGIDTIEAVAAGDVGYRLGTYWFETPDGTVVDRGKYIEVWRQVGGEWKIANDIWNSDWPVGAGTTTVVVTHKVKDADRWLAAWQGENSRRDQFLMHGVTDVRPFQNPDNPQMMGLVVDVADMDAFLGFLNSDEGAAAKAEDGVIDSTLHMYGEVK